MTHPNAIAHNEGDSSVLGLDVTREMTPMQIELGRRRTSVLLQALKTYREYGPNAKRVMDMEARGLLDSYLEAVGEVRRPELRPEPVEGLVEGERKAGAA